jgi:hypothetical protein
MMNKRYMLRRSSNPPSKLPERMRASNLAQWFWCAEQARLLTSELIVKNDEPKDAAEIGTMLHQVLDESMGKRFPHEEEFLKELVKFKDPEFGFLRKVQAAKLADTPMESVIYADLTGHPDDFQITPDLVVYIVEHKTVKGIPSDWFIQRYKLATARFQTQIYSFILEPFVNRLGGIMGKVNAVIYWNQPKEGEVLKYFNTYRVEYHAEETKEKILTAVRAFWNPEMIERFKPQEWKCDKCLPEFKSKCQYTAKGGK